MEPPLALPVAAVNGDPGQPCLDCRRVAELPDPLARGQVGVVGHVLRAGGAHEAARDGEEARARTLERGVEIDRHRRDGGLAGDRLVVLML